jgi:opacity protein-like surface antigen
VVSTFRCSHCTPSVERTNDTEVRKVKKIVALSVLALAALAFTASSAPASSSALVIPFEKHAVGSGHYIGTAGDGGTIEMQVYDSSFTGGDPATSDHWVQHFKATLQLTVGGQSLTAALEGQFNFTTLQTVINGVVVDGWLSGAQVHEEGTVTGFSPLTFVGTVRLMPGSAN